MGHEVLGKVERRRRWSAREKLAVVMAPLEPDAVISEVARRFDVARQQVYDWRRAARQGELGTPGGVVGFLEVVAGPATGDPAAEAEVAPMAEALDRAISGADIKSLACATVEIGLAGGRILRVPVGLPTAELQRPIGAVEGA